MKTTKRKPGDRRISQMEATFKMLQDLGVTTRELKLLRTNKYLASTVARTLRNSRPPWDTVYPASTSQKDASQIMDRNYCSPGMVWRGLGVRYTSRQLEKLAQVPFSEETLRQCRNTHLLMPGYPLSLMDLLRRWPEPYPDDVSRHAFVTKQRVALRWYLIWKREIPGSLGKAYKEQTLCSCCLAHEEEVPFACEWIYMSILYEKTRGKPLLPGIHIRCRDTDSLGKHVCVPPVGNGCVFFFSKNGEHLEKLGLASSVKPQILKS